MRTPKNQDEWRGVARAALREIKGQAAFVNEEKLVAALEEMVERPFVDLFAMHLRRAFELGLERGFFATEAQYLAALPLLENMTEPTKAARHLPRRAPSVRRPPEGRRKATTTLSVLPVVAEAFADEANRLGLSQSALFTRLFCGHKKIEVGALARSQEAAPGQVDRRTAYARVRQLERVARAACFDMPPTR